MREGADPDSLIVVSKLPLLSLPLELVPKNSGSIRDTGRRLSRGALALVGEFLVTISVAAAPAP